MQPTPIPLFRHILISKQTTCGGEEAVRYARFDDKVDFCASGGAVKGDGTVFVIHVIIDAQFVIDQSL